jgi:hypothetical protein
MSDRLRQRLKRNTVLVPCTAGTPAAAVAAGPAQPSTEYDYIPPDVRSYLSDRPAAFGQVVVNSRVRVDRLENGRGFGPLVLAEGWLGLEPWGVWTGGHRAVLYASSPFSGKDAVGHGDGAAEIVIDARGAISKEHRRLPFRMKLGKTFADFAFAWGEIGAALLRVPIPPELMGPPIMKLEIELDHPLSSPDGYLRGLGISSFAIRSGAGANAA